MYNIPLPCSFYFVSSGEISVNSPVNVDELLGQIVDLVSEQQKNTMGAGLALIFCKAF